jgi:hypothetical protein
MKFVSNILVGAACFIAAIGASASAQAEPTAAEAELIAFLDKETKPGILTFGKHGRTADGNYVVSAVFHRELRMPLNKLDKFCEAKGGTIKLLVGAAAIFPNFAGSADLAFSNEVFTVDQSDLFEWSGQPRSASAEPALNGFEAVFDRRLVASRTKTVAEANANPPLGLFGCFDANNGRKWTASIMAGRYGGDGWLYLNILPITHEFLAAKRQAAIAVKQNEEDWKMRQAEKQQEAEAFAKTEKQRLAPWRRALAIGSQTNCGLVINDRGTVLEIQLPSGVTGPTGERQFWVKREELADYPFPQGCTYGR